MQAGLQYHLPTHTSLPIPKIIELGRMAADGGIDQLWMTDNLGNRNTFVVLAALAGNLPISLGTAVMVQYFRSPVLAAGSLAAVTELMQGGELSVGIGRGNPRTPHSVNTPRPVSMMRETAQALRLLLDGEEVRSVDVPTLASYFNFAPNAVFSLQFPPAVPVRIYCGGDGPKALEIGGRHMDGLLCGPTSLPIIRMGYMEERLKVFDDAAADAGRGQLPRVLEVKISMSRDPVESRAFAMEGVGTRALSLRRRRGFSDDDLRRIGIEPADLDPIETAFEQGRRTEADVAEDVTDPMINAFFVSGDLGACREQVAILREQAEAMGVHQIVFSGIAADFPEGLRLLCEHIVPVLRD